MGQELYAYPAPQRLLIEYTIFNTVYLAQLGFTESW